ncbi:hypothetical protein [Candidatus Uabimicrobium sp. HlEnr_7]|uniref:hypothetical protein n=1 Tax=Candidatus Uabimicrobium helgolandensis TaxID=3095367 RepID=UPI0035567E21
MKYGQTYQQAATVELQEETNLCEKPNFLGKFVVNEEPDRMIVAVYNIISDKKITLDPTEAYNGNYYSLDEAERHIRVNNTTHWLPQSWEIVKNTFAH